MQGDLKTSQPSQNLEIMEVILPKKQIECARVFVNPQQRNELTLKCFYCCREFVHWTRFVTHIELSHANLELAYKRGKVVWAQMEDDHMSDAQTEAEEEFLTDKEEEHDEAENEKEPVEQIEEGDQQQGEDIEQTIDIEIKIEPQATEQVLITEETRMEHKCTSPVDQEFFNEDDDEGSLECESANEQQVKVKLPQLCEQPEMRVRRRATRKLSCSSTPSESMKSVQVKRAKMRRVHTRARAESSLSSQSGDFSDKVSADTIPHISVNSARIIQFRHTDPTFMLAFIAQMRQHPCQWDPKHADFNYKDRRDESAEQICNELQAQFKVALTAQIVRNSICYLRRWYEQEYLRHSRQPPTKRSSKPTRGRPVKCSHPQYYDQLAAFLPHEHFAQHPCEQCSRVFKTKQQLQSHQYHLHDGDLPYQCEYCGRRFLYQSMLRHHENRHTKERVFQCKLCDYNCATKTDYSLHMLTHTDIRAYVCDLCNASYKTSASYAVHRRSHGAPRLTCHVCGKKFYENYRLKQHLWHHEAEAATEKLKLAQEEDSRAEAAMENEVAESERMNEKHLESGEKEYCDYVEVVEGPSDSEDGGEVKGFELITDDMNCTLCESSFDKIEALSEHALKEHKVFIY